MKNYRYSRRAEGGFALMLVSMGLVALGLTGAAMLNEAGANSAFSGFAQNRVFRSVSSQMMGSYCAVLGSRFNNEINGGGTLGFNQTIPTNVLSHGIDTAMWDQAQFDFYTQHMATIPFGEPASGGSDVDDFGYLQNTGTVPVRIGGLSAAGYSWFIDVDVITKVEVECPSCGKTFDSGNRCLDAVGGTTGDCGGTAFEIDLVGNVSQAEEKKRESYTIQCSIAEQKNSNLTTSGWLDMSKPFSEYIIEYRFDTSLPANSN